jgi:hypothetical protein
MSNSMAARLRKKRMRRFGDMPSHDDFPEAYLDGPPRDTRTGEFLDGVHQARTDEDRRLQSVRERERWISAISFPAPASD